jgi:hypothetical protein
VTMIVLIREGCDKVDPTRHGESSSLEKDF